jgi:hypothetical protein
MSSTEATAVATTPTAVPPNLTDKQARILDYLREHAGSQTYFKSRLIANELGLSAKEVGANMRPLLDADHGLTIEKWGYSSGTTWMVTR